MKLQFTLTLDDHTAATRLFRKPVAGQGPGWGERLLFVWLLLGGFVLLLVASFVDAVLKVGGRGDGQSVGLWTSAILSPWVVYLLVFQVAWLLMCSAFTGVERRSLRAFMLTLSAILLMACALTTVLNGPTPDEPASHPTANPDSAHGVLVAWMPWLLVFGCIWVYLFRWIRRNTRRNWEAQPHLHLPQTVGLTPHGLRFDDGLCVRDCKWASFRKWRDDERQFLLYVSELAFYTIPKRAFPDAMSTEAFRALLLQHVPPVDPPQFGLVIPMAQPAAPPPTLAT
jgi:hypothetical protein